MFCSNPEERISFSLVHPSTITSYLASALRQVLSHSRRCQVPAWPDRFLLWLHCCCMRDSENAEEVTLSDHHCGIWPTWSPKLGIFLPTSMCRNLFWNKRYKVLLLQNFHIQTHNLHHTGQNQAGYISKGWPGVSLHQRRIFSTK